MKIRIAAALLATVAATAGQAASYRVTATGSVNRVGRIDGAGFAGNVSDGSVVAGDAIAFGFTLDSGSTALGRRYAADPTINVYSWSPRDIVLSMGGYTYTPARVSRLSSYVTLWNAHVSCCNDIADAESFGIFDDPFGANKAIYPFATGAGAISESLSLSLLDFTASARRSDLLDEIVDPVGFATKRFEYTLRNGTTGLFYHISSGDMAVTIAAIPEPSGWALAICGIGLIGGALRRSRRSDPARPMQLRHLHYKQ